MDYRIVKFWSLIPEEKRICAKCGKKITLKEADIHHKNGKRYDNSPDNLEINHKWCHSGGNENHESMVGISLRVPASLLQQIDKECENLGISQSEFTRNLMKEYFKN